jgi:uncharacterized BrkB/YihY/UPF0761 family membrane protein
VVEPADETPPESAARGPAATARSRRDAIQARLARLEVRAQDERQRHRSVDVAFEMFDRDVDAGGGIIAGALAYRFFIWLLPLALVSVAGLGLASDVASQSPQETAQTFGISGFVSRSIATSADGPARWYALLVGIPILVYATRSLLRGLITAHRLLWRDVRVAAPKPTLAATLRLLVLLLSFSVVTAVSGAVRSWAPGPGVLVTALAILPYAGLWLLISLRLPHRGADWRALVPGALVVGVGLELLHAFTAYVLEPYAVAKQGTYGALGAAAALLLGLFLLARLAVAGAVLNVTLWERGRREPTIASRSVRV